MIELYQFWDSPCCMKVRMVLAEKDLDWVLKPITTYQFDHFQPEYQALNPHSIVPTLIHDDRVIIQSSNIAEYLDDICPTPSLKPDDPGLLAQMREWMKEEEEFLFRLIITLSFNTMMKLREAGYGMDRLREWSKRHPDQNRAADYLQRVTAPADVEAIKAAENKFRWHMERLEKQINNSGGPWICGAEYSLADICLAGIVDRIEYLDKDFLFDGLTAVQDWLSQLKTRPAYQKATPPFADRMWGPKKSVEEYPYVSAT